MSRASGVATWLLHNSFGVRGGVNIASWGVACGIVYYMWILPQQQDAARRKSIVEEWKDKYRTEPSVYPVDRQPDVPDPLNRGLTTDKLRKGGDI